MAMITKVSKINHMLSTPHFRRCYAQTSTPFGARILLKRHKYL